MKHFGSELRFGLVKNTNQDKSFIYVVIPEVIIKFLIQYQSELNIYTDIITQFEPEEMRYLYTEEVEELQNIASQVLESLENINESRIFQDYRDKYHLSEINFSKEDVSEVFNHLIHICNVALNGQKILFVSSRFDDSAMIE
ncbi:hypothetical protein HPT25_16915 [Bacillus sp. BRMEA1]|uniref:hypothetical protein n=1 Tax=Neobacillus endophyticus TaxID=2738405 RepID=UPI001565359F|nr:hypothetical protein [Neobacillus endophyticus]NRD78527.1 hypothetical protein [Neobacillus endophyticus]NRD79042.1 hypothetical protein [Neobacillus endophyticus]